MEMAVRLDEGSGHAVVLLHGFPGNGADWEPGAGKLTDHFRVVVVDLLGFGSSSRPHDFESLWVESQARALAATLDDLGIERAALVGHDFGGPVALTFLRLHPDRVSHLGLLSTNVFSDTPVDFPLSLLKLPYVGPLLDGLFFSSVSLRGLGRAASKTRGGVPQRNDGGEARTVRVIFARVLRRLSELYGPLEASLPEVGVPTIVMWGDRDMFFPVSQGQRTAEVIPGARFVVLHGSGHVLPIERTDAVVEELVQLIGAGDNAG